MVDDGFSRATAFYAITGGPNNVTPATIPQHVRDLHVLDYPRSERIRQRVADTVKDAKTAETLKAWYPTWCKRPTFNDEYLQVFNQQNVTLVDVGRDGIQNFSPAGPIVNNTEYPLDVLIWSTGYESPAAGSYAEKCAMNIVGRNSLTMSERFQRGFTTLHGVTSLDLPNLFSIGSTQAGVSPNF